MKETRMRAKKQLISDVTTFFPVKKITFLTPGIIFEVKIEAIVALASLCQQVLTRVFATRSNLFITSCGE